MERQGRQHPVLHRPAVDHGQRARQGQADGTDVGVRLQVPGVLRHRTGAVHLRAGDGLGVNLQSDNSLIFHERFCPPPWETIGQRTPHRGVRAVNVKVALAPILPRAASLG